MAVAGRLMSWHIIVKTLNVPGTSAVQVHLIIIPMTLKALLVEKKNFL